MSKTSDMIVKDFIITDTNIQIITNMNIQVAIVEMDKGKMGFCMATHRFYRNIQRKDKPTMVYLSSYDLTGKYGWKYRSYFNKKEVLSDWLIGTPEELAKFVSKEDQKKLNSFVDNVFNAIAVEFGVPVKFIKF
jgi:c-di-AMP phosphodiesterase-like protein